MQQSASEPETIEAAWIASHMPPKSPPRKNYCQVSSALVVNRWWHAYYQGIHCWDKRKVR